MNDFIQTLLAICGGVSILGGAIRIIISAFSPFKKLVKQVEGHEEKLCNGNERLKKVEESNRMLLKCQLVVIEHLATGNHIDKLKETQEEVQDYLINRSD